MSASSKKWVWPQTFGRRFAFAMSVYQPVGFVASLLVGWFKQLLLAVTMLHVWLWVFVICTVISVGQAALARPGASFWKPLIPVEETD